MACAWIIVSLPTIVYAALWLAVGPDTMWQGFGFGILFGICFGLQAMFYFFAKQSKYLE
jgi:hypothetical protein